MTSQPNVTLPEPVLAAVRAEAERQHKSVSEMAGELIMHGLRLRKTDALDELMQYGQQKARETHPEGLTEENVAELVRVHREKRGS